MSAKQTTPPMEENNSGPIIDDQEFEAAVKEAQRSANVFTYKFPTPFSFEEESFDSLTFDFEALTGADSLAIENELAQLGRVVITPEFSGDYLIRMAMRACTVRRKDGRRLGIDAFSAMPISAFIKIRGAARSFLMRVGS